MNRFDFPPDFDCPRCKRRNQQDGTPPRARAQAFGVHQHAEANYHKLSTVSTAAIRLAVEADYLNCTEHFYACYELLKREKKQKSTKDTTTYTEEDLEIEFWQALAHPQQHARRDTCVPSDSWDDLSMPMRPHRGSEPPMWDPSGKDWKPKKSKIERIKELRKKSSDSDGGTGSGSGSSSGGSIPLGSMHAGSVPL